MTAGRSTFDMLTDESGVHWMVNIAAHPQL